MLLSSLKSNSPTENKLNKMAVTLFSFRMCMSLVWDYYFRFIENDDDDQVIKKIASREIQLLQVIMRLISSLHWTISVFFYAFFVQWSRLATIPSLPPLSFYWSVSLLFYIIHTMLLHISHSHLQTMFSSFICR